MKNLLFSNPDKITEFRGLLATHPKLINCQDSTGNTLLHRYRYIASFLQYSMTLKPMNIRWIRTCFNPYGKIMFPMNIKNTLITLKPVLLARILLAYRG